MLAGRYSSRTIILLFLFLLFLLPSLKSPGAVFSFVLFLKYVNDINDGLTLKILNCADDTKLASKVTTTRQKPYIKIKMEYLVGLLNGKSNLVSINLKCFILFNIIE